MKKLLLLGLLASGLMSNDKGLYIGIDAYKTRTNLTVTDGYISEKQNLTRPSQTLKIGYYLNKNGRLNAFYQHENRFEGSNGCLYGVGYDYLMGSNRLKPFIGVLLGYTKYSQPDIRLAGHFVGIDAGLNYPFGENFSIEGGYRYILPVLSNTFSSSTSQAKFDTQENWFIGANYKF